MKSGPEIALAFPRGGHQEVLIEGVLAYAADRNLDWSFVAALESPLLSIKDLARWRGDGILAAISTREEAECALTINTPLVNITSSFPDLPTPACIVDNRAIGRMAADHLVSKGFRNLLFYGLRDVNFSSERQAGFEEVLDEAGYQHDCFLDYPSYSDCDGDWLQKNHGLAEWLQGRKTPLGMFAVSDYRARAALDACRAAGLKVPEDIAVVGVDNEELVCSHVRPTLSSIARNDRLRGYRAAELLHRLMLGETVPRSTSIPPLEVVERDSTQIFAVSDARLRDAMEFLHRQMHEPDFTIDAVARHANVSRRWLEYAFRDSLRETPYQYLRRQRLARARWLLVEKPNQTIQRVALATGFTSAKQFAFTFKQEVGMSPREYRRTARS
ncbi:MAG: DNA-binding transcriptional regulator [Planctomycetales bacterium]|nr:DNA-binding transcriptional regulator [Planctomycetales bacterium]